eukprot:406085-Amphidinium_carterae.1
MLDVQPPKCTPPQWPYNGAPDWKQRAKSVHSAHYMHHLKCATHIEEAEKTVRSDLHMCTVQCSPQ